MAREKKSGKDQKKSKDESSRVRFEIEESAEQFMLEYLDEFKPDKADADEPFQQRKSVKRAPKGLGLIQLDLHGLRLEEALQLVRAKLDALRATTGMHRIKIVTGKGHHSQGGESILAKEVHSFVLQTYRRCIVEIEDSPDQVRLAGVPLRGHFHVTILGKR